MKSKHGWLIVILISTVQTALLLFAVLTLFSWFSTKTEQAIGTQVCTDNHVIAGQIAKSIEQAKIESPQTDRTDASELSLILANVKMPNGGFACVVDAVRGETYGNLPSKSALIDSIGDLKLQPLGTSLGTSLGTPNTPEGASLLQSVTRKSSGRQSAGAVEIGPHRHFVSVNFLPRLDAVLIVGQRSDQSTNGLFGNLAYAKHGVFAATLLVGLVCMCLIVSTLNRESARAEDLNSGLEKQVSQREKELVKTQNAVIFGLAKLAESRDNDTGEHLDRIRSYVTILSKDLARRNPEVTEEFVHNLGLASSLHDIGKVGIPDSILLKPGRLTKEEREVMELHALIGGECLEAIQNRLGDNLFMHTAKQVAYYHHERWDGKGYPHGLVEHEIPLVARIVAVADVYDALTSKRPYKQPMSHVESRGIILAGSGTQFDPEVVAAFLRHESEFEAISKPQLELSDADVLSDFHLLCERAQAMDPEAPMYEHQV